MMLASAFDAEGVAPSGLREATATPESAPHPVLARSGAVRGVLLLGGKGTRVSSLTAGRNKHFLQVVRQSLAEHAIGFLACSGVQQITVVCGESDLEGFRSLLGTGSRWSAELAWAVQPAPLGTAHAVWCARHSFAGRDTTVTVLFGDNLFQYPQLKAARPLDDGLQARLFVTASQTPQHFGVVHVDQAGEISDIECKPSAPRSNLVCTGLMQFAAPALHMLTEIRPNDRGERDLMDLVISLWRHGRLGWEAVDGCWADVTTHPDVVGDVEQWAAKVSSPARLVQG